MVADPVRADALAVEIQQRNTMRRPGLASRPFSRSRTALDILPRLEAAVAAIWGTKDPTVGPYLDERVAGVRAAVPDAAIAVLEGCGHWIMQERPDALAAFLADTMKRDTPAATTGEDHQ